MPAAPELVRSYQLRVSLTVGQEADIRAIAEAWEVESSLVAYSAIAIFLVNPMSTRTSPELTCA